MADSRNKRSTELVLEVVDACTCRHASKGQSLVVGFSGGLDSTVLLHASHQVASVKGLILSAVHVNHGLSPKAEAWAAACAEFCVKLGISLAVQRVQVPIRSREGVEAAARSLRHKALSAYPADWILLGHHADDQAETVLHNLLRGAGVRGAAGMPEARGRVLRPLLALARANLSEYASEQRLAWVEDESNRDQRYTRNFLRSGLIPMLAPRFPRARAQLAAAASRFGEAESLLLDLAQLDLQGRPPKFPLPLKHFRDLSEARGRNLLRAMLAWHEMQSPDERRLSEFVRQLRSAGYDRHPRIDLKHYSLWCAAGEIHFATAA